MATQPQINPVWWWTLIKHLAANDSQSSQAPMSAGCIREKPEDLLTEVLTLTFGIRRLLRTVLSHQVSSHQLSSEQWSVGDEAHEQTTIVVIFPCC